MRRISGQTPTARHGPSSAGARNGCTDHSHAADRQPDQGLQSFAESITLVTTRTSFPAYPDYLMKNPDSATAPVSERLWSMDAYRGLAMLLMSSEGLGLMHAAGYFPESHWWQALAFHTDHVQWRGWCLWDLIQPSFMFLAGASTAFSYVKRQATGESYWHMFGHALVRSIVLILLGIFLRSMGQSQTYFTFEDVLTQIGLGYMGLFLLWNRSIWDQALVAILLLLGYFAAVEAHPTRPPGFDRTSVGVSPEWQAEHGLPPELAHWEKNTNLAADADVWFLNLFPRKERFVYNGGGYQTLNFVPSLATMILGLIAGSILRRWQNQADKLVALTVLGFALLSLGIYLDAADICPLVKRIWTPTWAVWSAGVAMLTLALFYLLVDIVGLRRLAWPMVVVGSNSIVVYVLAWIAYPFFKQNLATHFGTRWMAEVANLLGQGDPRAVEALVPVISEASVLFCFWLICVWLWKQRTFIKI